MIQEESEILTEIVNVAVRNDLEKTKQIIEYASVYQDAQKDIILFAEKFYELEQKHDPETREKILQTYWEESEVL